MPPAQRLIFERQFDSTDSLRILADGDTVTFRTNFTEPDLEPGYHLWQHEHQVVACAPQALLEAVTKVRHGRPARIRVRDDAGDPRFRSKHASVVLTPQTVQVTTIVDISLKCPIRFDALYLDCFSVLENGEARKRSMRSVELTECERALLEIIRSSPTVVNRMSPREFEVVVGIALSQLGMKAVTISRYTVDDGVDIYGLLAEGGREEVVVVEVKHYRRRPVGIAIVDRLNGVRVRTGAAKAAVVTSSRITKVAQNAYRASHDTMALIDYERLIDLLAGDPEKWSCSASGLWSTRSSC